jgi:hypothetical protein
VTPIEACLRRLKRDLNAARVPWAIVGGFAVQARAYNRTTLDIDAAVVAADDEAADTLKRRLIGLGYRVLAGLENTDVSRLGTLRLISPVRSDVELVVDLLFASAGIEAEVVKGAGEVQVFLDLTLPVATLGHLVAMKCLSESELRTHDARDLVELIKRSKPSDLDLARSSIDLVIERGYSRGKDLHATLERFIALAAQQPGL